MNNVFVYGTLMYDEVSMRIVNNRYQKINATVEGFKRLGVKNEHYPALIRDSGVVNGLVILDVTDDDLERLDIFEGPYYQRELIEATLDDDETLSAFVYLFRKEYAHLLLENEWSILTFEKEGLNQFIEFYDGFSRV